MRGVVTAVGAVAVIGCCIAAARADQSPAVVVRDQAGRELARAALPGSGRFALEYRHSYYGAPARETFQAAGRGGEFAVAAIESPSEAVLDYYAIEGRKRAADDGWLALVPTRPRRYRELSLIATPTGRRTLAVGERRVPLFETGRANHVAVSIDRGSG